MTEPEQLVAVLLDDGPLTTDVASVIALLERYHQQLDPKDAKRQRAEQAIAKARAKATAASAAADEARQKAEAARKQLEDAEREAERAREVARHAKAAADEAQRTADVAAGKRVSTGNGSIFGKLPQRLPPLIDDRHDLISVDKPHVTPDPAAKRALDKFVTDDLQSVSKMSDVLAEARKEKAGKNKLDVLTQATLELNREPLDDVTRLLLSDERVFAWAALKVLKEGN